MCTAVFRVFGRALAEVPLVATRSAARRCGHARVLITALERLLAGLGCASLALPAAASTVDTWIGGFGFRHLSPEAVAATRAELRVLIFPGERSSVPCCLANACQWPQLPLELERHLAGCTVGDDVWALVP